MQGLGAAPKTTAERVPRMLRSVEAKSTLAFSACGSPPELARGSSCVSRRASSRRGGAEAGALQRQEGQCCATSHCCSTVQVIFRCRSSWTSMTARAIRVHRSRTSKIPTPQPPSTSRTARRGPACACWWQSTTHRRWQRRLRQETLGSPRPSSTRLPDAPRLALPRLCPAERSATSGMNAMLPQPPMQARPPGPGIWERVGGAGIPVDNPEPPAVTCDCEQPGSRVDDFASHGGRDPGTDGGQVRGERRRARRCGGAPGHERRGRERRRQARASVAGGRPEAVLGDGHVDFCGVAETPTPGPRRC